MKVHCVILAPKNFINNFEYKFEQQTTKLVYAFKTINLHKLQILYKNYKILLNRNCKFGVQSIYTLFCLCIFLKYEIHYLVTLFIFGEFYLNEIQNLSGGAWYTVLLTYI